MTFVNAAWHVHEDLFVDNTVSSLAQRGEEAAQLESPLREIGMNGGVQKRSTQKITNVSKYVHVPHRDKPPTVVAKRNARERRRVQAVNSAFVRLRKAVPFENNRGKRVSKVKTLQYAIDYIQNLQDLLRDYNDNQNVAYYYNYYQSPDQQSSNSELLSIDFSDSFEVGY